MTLKARLFARPGPWQSVGVRVIRTRGPKGVKIHVNFGEAVSIQLRRTQAINLINTIADALEP